MHRLGRSSRLRKHAHPFLSRARKRAVLLLFQQVASVLLAAFLLQAAQHTARQGKEALDPHGRIKIFCAGGVHLTGVSGSHLIYRLTRPGDDSRIEVARQGAEASFRAFAPSVELQIPRTLEWVTVTSAGGDLEIGNLDGSLRAESAGRIVVGRIGREADIRSAGGSVTLGTVAGTVKCVSVGGSIVAESVGDADIQTGGGDIVIKKSSGHVRVYTAGGGIRILHPEGPVVAKNLGGPIEIGAARGAVCQSASGSIRLLNVTGAIEVSTGAGSVTVQLASAGSIRNSSLSTRAGDITVSIPSNLQISIRAQNQGSGRRGIITDFSALRITSRGDSAKAEGALNGGGPLLRLSAVGGSIYIRKR